MGEMSEGGHPSSSPLVRDGNWICGGDQFVVYTDVKLYGCTPETDITKQKEKKISALICS